MFEKKEKNKKEYRSQESEFRIRTDHKLKNLDADPPSPESYGGTSFAEDAEKYNHKKTQKTQKF